MWEWEVWWCVVQDGKVSGGEFCCGVDAVLPWLGWSAGDKLKKSTSLAKAINESIHQQQISAHPVKEIVCSLVLKIGWVGHRVGVEWVASEVLVDHEQEVK